MNQACQTGQQYAAQIESGSVATYRPDPVEFKQLRSAPSKWAVVKNIVLTMTALAILALPISVVLSSKRDVFAKIPLLKQFGSGAIASQSAVLAVDATGLTIRSRDTSAAARERYENATVEKLANLHRIYTAWAQNNENLFGTLHLKLLIAKSGKVVKVDPLTVRLSSADFSKVVFDEIRLWSFPPSETEPVEITIPLLFVPKGMDASTVVQWERKTNSAPRDEKPVAAFRVANNPSTVSTNGSVSTTSLSSSASPRKEIMNASFAKLKNQIDRRIDPSVFKTTQAVGLRQQPRFSAKRFHEVDAETELNVIENNGDWCKVKVANVELVGFVRKEFITPIN
jgi:hypothetical protein